MPSTPILYNLFWRTFARERVVPVALRNENVIAEPVAVPAIILFPALLTPAVHVRQQAREKDVFEILIAARETDPAKLAPQVNLRLKVTLGLDPAKRPSFEPLFEDPNGEIEAQEVRPDGNGILKTPGGFRGILHPKFQLPKSLPKFYAVRISASCLERAAQRPPTEETDRRRPVEFEIQDQIVEATLRKMNGPDLRGEMGFGTHCFSVEGASVNLAMPDITQRIRAYHPLFVYPEGGLTHAKLGHVSDIHINGRQQVLRRSDARVIDVDDDAVSPRIGSLINVYSSNFQAILRDLKAAGADVLLLGGDLIDHVRNCFPWAKDDVPAPGTENAGKIWKLVDLDAGGNYDARYQAFLDHITLYSIVRDFCETHRTPMFVVTGNHDAYEEAYGISPRVLGARANEGIPADHNLTFYEAMLVFGESYKTVKKGPFGLLGAENFNADLFEWFFNVLTPFSDYAVELPNQRVVGLHWGEDEEIISAPFTGHGMGHLPRAKKAGSSAQVALAQDGFRSDKRTVLFSHFTFVSYHEEIPNLPAPQAGEVKLGSTRFGDHDYGTFEQKREDLYTMTAAPSKMQCVFTGHSHRKGLYHLGSRSGGGYQTQMFPIPPAGPHRRLMLDKRFTPIVVSDCAGPLPRLNYEGEFLAWGSDRPGGTFLEIDEEGTPVSVVAIQAPTPEARPRVAVALEYLHVLQAWYSLTDEVLGSILVAPFRSSRALAVEHVLRIPLGRAFDRVRARIATVGLYCKPSVGAPWEKIALHARQEREGLVWKTDVAIATIPKDRNAAFMKWLTAPAVGRFLSLGIRPDGRSGPAALSRYNWTSPWNFEVDCRMASGEDGGLVRYLVVPRFEAPNFEWRKKFPRYQS